MPSHVRVLLDRAKRRERAHREPALLVPRQTGQAGNELDVDDGAVLAGTAPDAKQQVGPAGEGGAGVALLGEKAESLGQGCGFENGKGHVCHQQSVYVDVSHTGTHNLYVKQIVA